MTSTNTSGKFSPRVFETFEEAYLEWIAGKFPGIGNLYETGRNHALGKNFVIIAKSEHQANKVLIDWLKIPLQRINRNMATERVAIAFAKREKEKRDGKDASGNEED